MDFIRRLQSKPKHVRTRYTLLISAGLTGVITLFWISSLPAQFSQFTVSSEQTDDTEGGPGLTDLLDQTRDQFGTIIEAANQREERDTESSDTPPSSLESLGNKETSLDETNREPQPQTPLSAPQNETPSSSGPRVIMIGTTTVRQ